MLNDRGRLQDEAPAPSAATTDALRRSHELLAALSHIQARFISEADAAKASSN